jgi:F-type H+-transporting ATPase subunit b
MSFDWTTLALQTVNLLVLVWLLRRFLFGPVTAMIAQRRMAAEKLLAEAEKARQTASDEAERSAQAREKLTADGDRIRQEALTAARAEQEALMQRARDDIASSREATTAEIERERTELRRELEADARQLAIASHLLARLSDQANNARLLRMPEIWFASLPEQSLDSLVRNGERLELITPFALDPSARAGCQRMLRQRLGTEVDLQFHTDPALIAGIELRSPHIRLRNNWQADLDRMAEELSRDDQHLAVA